MRPSEALEKHRAEIVKVLGRYPVANPRLFGSTARGEDTETSDIDILVERREGLTYFRLASLEEDLLHLTGVKVDVRTEGEFSARTMDRLKRDLRPL
ncbi:MAG: nucleotidyltransferase family protein [Rhizobiaceae bacterium]|nr:nucleotidyltransferase family protein [Rhizobiaceae bacterium]